MTGAQDGSVRMFEWNRPQQLICFRQAGNARVTRLYFNSQGNKVRPAGARHTLCHALSLVYTVEVEGCPTPCTVHIIHMIQYIGVILFVILVSCEIITWHVQFIYV